MAFAVVFLPTPPDLNGWANLTLGGSNNSCCHCNSSKFGKQKGQLTCFLVDELCNNQKRIGATKPTKRSFLRPSWHAKGCFDSLMFLFCIRHLKGLGWSIVSSMSTGSCCSPWWINSCNPSLGFDELLYWSLVWIPHQEKVVGVSVYVWWLPESYDLKYTVEVWTVMEIGKILFPNRSMPWTDLWCGDGRHSQNSHAFPPLLLHLTANLQQKCSQVVCGCFHLFVVQPSFCHKKQVIS